MQDLGKRTKAREFAFKFIYQYQLPELKNTHVDNNSDLLEKKLEEFKAIMTGDLAKMYTIKNKGLDLMEIQGSPEEIAKTKVKLAATKCKTPVLTEDVSLCFNAYNGLPGPYIKDFLGNIGREGLWKMV